MNRNIIFTWKLLSISASIINGYAAVAHFKDHPLFGFMYCGLLLYAVLSYTIPYEKAFKVPTLFNRVKSLLHVQASMLDVAERRVVRRQVMSIQAEGIKVGEFHTLERTSPPVFLNYVLCNIVNMLVALG